MPIHYYVILIIYILHYMFQLYLLLMYLIYTFQFNNYIFHLNYQVND